MALPEIRVSCQQIERLCFLLRQETEIRLGDAKNSRGIEISVTFQGLDLLVQDCGVKKTMVTTFGKDVEQIVEQEMGTVVGLSCQFSWR